MRLTIESEQEDGGRWIAEVRELPGVLSSIAIVMLLLVVPRLALRVVADRLEHGEATPGEMNNHL